MLKAVLLLLAALAIILRRRRDDRLPWTVLWVLTAVFTSRAYWPARWGTLRLEQIACLALFLHFLVDLLRRRRWPRFGPLPLLLPAMLPFMLLGSWLASPLPVASLHKTLIYFPYLAGFAALCHFLDGRERFAAAWDFLVRFGSVMLAASLAGYLLFFAGVDLGMVRVEYGAIWLRGSLVTPNIFGAAAGIVLIATVVRILASGRVPTRRRVLDHGALAVAAASLLVSFSRASLALTLLAVAAAFMFTRGERSARLGVFSVLLLSFLAAAAIIVAGSRAYSAKVLLHPVQRPAAAGEFGEPALDQYWNAKRHSLDATGQPFRQRFKFSGSTVRWRLWVAGEALRDWRKSPLIGRGTDSLLLSHPAVPQYYLPVTALVVLHDWGIVAFALYAAFMLLACFRLWRQARLPAPAPGLALAVFLVFLFHALQSQITTTMQLGSFWVLAALFAAAAGTAPGADGEKEKRG